jgi:microcystin-dependent protein
MAIQESDIMDFGNGIIGDDTFDVWRKKTNGIRQEIEVVEGILTTKINTDIGALTEIYIPQAGQSTFVSTPLQFSSAAQFLNTISVGGSLLSGSESKLICTPELESSTQITSNKVRAASELILGTKTYTVPSPPAINNAVLTSATTNGDLAWQNAATLFEQSGGLEQTTTVFEEVMPVGSIIALGGLTNDTNYLLCEGGSVPGGINGEYKDLFDVIGYTYGGSGNNFELPDYRGRVPVGTDSAGGFNAGSLGDYGGTSNTNTNNHSLSIDQIPAHQHFIAAAGTPSESGLSADKTLDTQFAIGDPGALTTNANFEYILHGNSSTADVGLTNKVGGNSQGETVSHSHGITPSDRVQPYIAIKYYIKAKKNTKVDFRIDIANSGLVSTDSLGAGQTVISPVNDTIQLDVDPDNTSIALVNGKVAIKTSPTIPGTITTSGPEFILNNSTRAGSNSHAGRAIVHGDGAGEGDPVLNGFDRKTVTTINDSGADANNDTLIINYNDISPNSFGDFTNGVIINGMKAIMFEDGSILQTGTRQRGNFKKATETQSGQHHTVAPQYSDAFCYVDDEDDVVIGGNSNGVYRSGANNSNGHSYRAKMMLPDDEKVDKLYIGYYNTHVIAKSGKTYSVGYGYSAASISSLEKRHRNSYFNSWERSFCESNNCKMSKIVYSGDISSHNAFALDDLGYFWGHGVNSLGVLANGSQTHSDNEDVLNATSLAIIERREELTNSETTTAGRPYNLAANRTYRSHVMNPMLKSYRCCTHWFL